LFLRQADKGNIKAHRVAGHEGPGRELRYGFTLCLTVALDAVRCSTQAAAAFAPGKKTRYPLNRRLGGAQGQTCERQKLLMKQYKLSHAFREILKAGSGTLSFQCFTDVAGTVSSSNSEGDRSYSRLAKHTFTTISATVWHRVRIHKPTYEASWLLLFVSRQYRQPACFISVCSKLFQQCRSADVDCVTPANTVKSEHFASAQTATEKFAGDEEVVGC